MTSSTTSANESERLRARVAELEDELASAEAERREALERIERRDDQWRFYERLFHSVPVGIAYINRDLVFQLCNQTNADFLGRAVDQVVGAHLHEVVPDNPAIWELVDQVFATGESMPTERLSVVFADQRAAGSREFLIASITDTAADGFVRGVFVTAQEVTELVRTRDALAFLTDASTQLAGSIDFETTLRTASDLAVPRLADFCMFDIVDGDAGYVVARAVDPEREALLYEVRRHYPFDPRESAPWTTLIRERGPLLAPDADEGQIAALARDAGHADYLRRIGARSTLFIPLQTDEDMVGIVSLGMAESGRQFTPSEQRLAEELARRVATSVANARIHRDAQSARARYLSLFEGAADAIVVVDGDGQFIDVNPAMTELTGYTRDELLRFRAGDGALTAAGPDVARPRFEQIKREGAFRGEMELRRKDGSLVPVESVIRSINLPGGSAFINMMRDISHRRELERMQREFLAIVTHELKGPLTSIKGFSQIMQRQAAYSERGIESILLQTGQLERLIDDMLDTARVDAGRLELQREPTDLIDLARTAIEQARASAPGHRFRVVTDLDQLVGDWDQERLVQVFANLLSNAIKYSPAGSDVVVTIEHVGDSARVSVIDHGSGIPQASLPRIFERFYRVDDPRRGRVEGLGLGLHITRSLIEAHGGSISVASEVGAGSTFTFTLPCSDADAWR